MSTHKPKRKYDRESWTPERRAAASTVAKATPRGERGRWLGPEPGGSATITRTRRQKPPAAATPPPATPKPDPPSKPLGGGLLPRIGRLLDGRISGRERSD